MKKRTKRLLSLLLSFVMVMGTLPSVALRANAETFAWNPDATMTLTCEDVVVEPREVIETADTKMKIYRVESAFDYTLTTSEDNDYAVLFEVILSVIEEDEYGHKDYDYEMTVTLDNVTIRTRNPRADQNAGVHAAMMFSDEKAEDRYETLNIELVGDNTVELLGVADDTADDVWSAAAFVGPNTVIKGSGTLNASCRYSDAVGAVSAVYTENTIGLYDTVTLNATADVEAKAAGTLLGDGLYFDEMNFITGADTAVNIRASGSGIVHNTATVYPKYLDDLEIGGDMHIRAADHGIHWPAGRLYVGDGASFSIAGLTEDTVPEEGIRIRRDVIIGEGCTFTVDARDSAVSCRVITTANPSAPLTLGKNSVAALSGSLVSPVPVVDCGTKLQGTNNVVSGTGQEWFGESYPFSGFTLEEGAKLSISGGYLALRAAAMELSADSELEITMTKRSESDNVEEYAPVYLPTSKSYVRSGAALTVQVPAESAIYGYSSLYLESDEVYVRAAEEAISSGYSLYRGTDPVIYTFESDDGVNWIPFANKNGKPYFTTGEPDTHICAASRPANTSSDKVWTPIEGEGKHVAKCLYCASDIVADCQWDNGVWSYVSAGVYELKFECEICENERISDVPYHSHAFGNWVGYTDEYDQKTHKGSCTVEGCEARTEEYCSNNYGEEYHIGLTTMRKDCKKCGNFSIRELDDSVETVHYAAKEPDCRAPGNVEFWVCGHCDQYYADESCTTVLSPADAFRAPGPHSYEDGVCTACGDKVKTLSFRRMTEDEPGYGHDGFFFIAVGEADGEVYAMGNATGADGSRAGVEIPSASIDENGILTVSSADAEFMSWVWDDDAFLVDGGYFSMEDGRTYVYDIARKSDSNNARPARFELESYGGSGLGCLWASPNSDYSDKEYLTFNAETKTFEVSDSEEYTHYLYIQLCDHPNLAHEGEEATCTEQGIREHWFCDKCGTYYCDAAGTEEMEIPEDVYRMEEYLMLRAKGHRFNSEGICDNCDMKKPVYRQISTQTAFEALDEESSYIIVFKDGEKTYAARLPELEYPCDKDTDGDGVVDAMEADTNKNDIPDCIEDYIDTNWGSVDYDESGTTTSEEYNKVIRDYNDDGVVDMEDYKRFFEYDMHWNLHYSYEEAAMAGSNFVEVTMADGTITLADEGAMELSLMPAGEWGGGSGEVPMMLTAEEPDPEETLETEYYAAWVPNYWVGASGMMGYYSEDHFRTQERVYGDREYPGIMDHKNWKISFRKDGSACLVDTWEEFDDTGALQLAKYTDGEGNAAMTIVGLPEGLWSDSEIMQNRTALLPAYLFASKPEYDHEHVWSDWEDNEDGETHSRRCSAEGCPKETETADHRWDNGAVTTAPTCTEKGVKTYTCSDCGATKEEDVDPLDHDWGAWETVKEPTETEAGEMRRVCKRDASHVETDEIAPHEHSWSDWESDGDKNHKRVCLDEACGKEEFLPHSWDRGTVTKEPDCIETGVRTYTCETCGHTREEDIPVIDHEYGRWVDDENGETHSRHCTTDGCAESESEAHKMTETVTQAPDYGVPGEKYRHCEVCGYAEEFITIPALETCLHACSNCGGCTEDAFCMNEEKCGCGRGETLTFEPLAEEDTGLAITNNGVPVAQTVDIVVNEVTLPGNEDDGSAAIGAPVNPYEQYVLNGADGYAVETVYDIELQITTTNSATGEETTEEYELGAGEKATVRLNVGADNAKAIEDGTMFLVHIKSTEQGIQQEVYGKGMKAVTVEKDGDGNCTGFISFETESFSPFVLVSQPELSIALDAKAVNGGCSVKLTSNAAYRCNLYVAVYSSSGQMLAAKVISNCNLGTAPSYTLHYSGTGATVKAFMLESGSSYAPMRVAAEDSI